MERDRDRDGDRYRETAIQRDKRQRETKREVATRHVQSKCSWPEAEEPITRDPGCGQRHWQGDLPERDREGIQGRFPAGPEC